MEFGLSYLIVLVLPIMLVGIVGVVGVVVWLIVRARRPRVVPSVRIASALAASVRERLLAGDRPAAVAAVRQALDTDPITAAAIVDGIDRQSPAIAR